MISEPYKIKEVKKTLDLKPYERWNVLKKARFNTFHVSSDHITFDLASRGMSSWSHFQKAAYMIGDEAYAGSRNYLHLAKSAQDVLGLSQIVPTHNGIGAEKLLTTTMLKSGQRVLHNRGRCEGLVPANGGKSVDISCKDPVSCFFFVIRCKPFSLLYFLWQPTHFSCAALAWYASFSIFDRPFAFMPLISPGLL